MTKVVNDETMADLGVLIFGFGAAAVLALAGNLVRWLVAQLIGLVL